MQQGNREYRDDADSREIAPGPITALRPKALIQGKVQKAWWRNQAEECFAIIAYI